MQKIQIFHNPRCSKSREAIALLEDRGLDFEVIEYLKTGISKSDLKKLLKKLDLKAGDLIRKKDKLFKELTKGNEDFTNTEYFELLAENIALMERPVIVKGDRAVIARPIDACADLLDSK